MEPEQFYLQFLDFSKRSFEATFNTIVFLQDQAEGLANVLMDQAVWIPEDSKRAFGNLVDAYKQARWDFYLGVEDGFRQLGQRVIGSEREETPEEAASRPAKKGIAERARKKAARAPQTRSAGEGSERSEAPLEEEGSPLRCFIIKGRRREVG